MPRWCARGPWLLRMNRGKGGWLWPLSACGACLAVSQKGRDVVVVTTLIRELSVVACGRQPFQG